jgi:hypothetical protein
MSIASNGTCGTLCKTLSRMRGNQEDRDVLLFQAVAWGVCLAVLGIVTLLSQIV